MLTDSLPVLGLFAKWPDAGVAKTRLAAETSPEFAAKAALAFLSDCLIRYIGVDARRVLSWTSVHEIHKFERLTAGTDWELIPQSAGDLGERMADFFAQRFKEGAQRVVLLGSDSPTVPLDYVEQALAALNDVDVAIGPATDGGYYLIGGTPYMPPLFHGIRWSQPTVLAETMTRISASPARLALLPPWYDVDTLADWQMLHGHVAAMRRSGLDPCAPGTEALLRAATVYAGVDPGS